MPQILLKRRKLILLKKQRISTEASQWLKYPVSISFLQPSHSFDSELSLYDISISFFCESQSMPPRSSGLTFSGFSLFGLLQKNWVNIL